MEALEISLFGILKGFKFKFLKFTVANKAHALLCQTIKTSSGTPLPHALMVGVSVRRRLKRDPFCKKNSSLV